jgi:eukaryotic-like serine/threonine-protein kinase
MSQEKDQPTAIKNPGLANFAFASSTDLPDATFANTLSAAASAKTKALDLSDPAQRQLGNYQLISKLGQGGMGVVFRAREPKLDREVALKLLAAGAWSSPEFVARFRAEAQLAARLHHPNIVPIFEIDQVDDLLFFTMALIEGESLSSAIKSRRTGDTANKSRRTGDTANKSRRTGDTANKSRRTGDTADASRGKFAEIEAAKLMRTIAEAIDYAHRLGVLHLDLKPANILLDRRGEPQVADFGLSRRLDNAILASDEISGTPNFMAPEQFNPALAPLSAATDIYGMGGVLYQMLTGAPAFIDESVPKLRHRVLHEPALSAHIINPSVSADMAAICAKCLEKTPGNRYASARALADDLQRLIEQREVSVHKLTRFGRFRRWAKREPRVAAAIFASFAALGAGLAGTGYQAALAKQAAARAMQEAGNARRISSFLTTILSEADPTQNRGKPPTAVDLLDRARIRIDRAEFVDQPLLNAELNVVMAKSYRGQSKMSDCVTLAKRANTLASKLIRTPTQASTLPEDTNTVLAQARLIEAECSIQLGRMDDALVLLAQNLTKFPNDPKLALERLESSVLSARALRLSDRRPQARVLLETLMAESAPQDLALKPVWARAQLALGRILDEDSETDRAIALMRSGIDYLSVADGPDAPGVLSAQIELGQMEIMKVCDRNRCLVDRTKSGFAKIDAAINELTRVLGTEHIAVAFALTNRGDMHQLTRDDVAALADYQRAFTIADRISPNSRYALNYSLSAAETLIRLERYEQATAAYQELALRLPKTEGMNPEALKAYQRDLKAGLCGIQQKAPERARNFRTPANVEGC